MDDGAEEGGDGAHEEAKPTINPVPIRVAPQAKKVRQVARAGDTTNSREVGFPCFRWRGNPPPSTPQQSRLCPLSGEFNGPQTTAGTAPIEWIAAHPLAHRDHFGAVSPAAMGVGGVFKRRA